MRKVYSFPVVAFSLLASGCASIPDATVSYYLPKSSVNVQVTRTISCVADGQPVMMTNSVANVVYTADPTAREEVNLTDLNGAFSNTEFSVGYYEDGRLKSINSGTTGQGEAVAKALVSAVGGLASLPDADVSTRLLSQKEVLPLSGLKEKSKDESGAKTDTVCAIVRKLNEKDKTITLSYSGSLEDVEGKRIATLYQEGLNTDIHDKLIKALNAEGQYKEKVGYYFIAKLDDDDSSKNYLKRLKYDGKNKVTVKMRSLKQSIVTISEVNSQMTKSPPKTLCPTKASPPPEILCPSRPIGVSIVDHTAPLLFLPLPSPALVGRVKVTAEFAQSGELSSISYTSESGAAAGLNTGAALAGARTSVVTAETAALRAQADYMAQQQRLTKCYGSGVCN